MTSIFEIFLPISIWIITYEPLTHEVYQAAFRGPISEALLDTDFALVDNGGTRTCPKNGEYSDVWVSCTDLNKTLRMIRKLISASPPLTDVMISYQRPKGGGMLADFYKDGAWQIRRASSVHDLPTAD
jgi:hypothetical protein